MYPLVTMSILSSWGPSPGLPGVDGAAILRSHGLPMQGIPPSAAAFSTSGLSQMNGAMGAQASMHELPGRPSYHTQQSIAMNYAGVQKFAGDVFRDGTMVFTDNRHRDGTQRSPHSMMSFVEMNRFLRDDDDGRLFQNPRAFAFNHTLIGKFHADQVEGNHLERNILGRDLINPKRSLVYSSHISGVTSYDNYWGRLLSMGTQAWLMLREVKTSTEAGRQRRDAVLALLGGPKGSTASLDALQRAQAEMMKSNNAKYLQWTPLVRGYTFRQVCNFESKLRSPDYAFYYVGLCVDNGAYNQTTAAKDDSGIMYVEKQGALWNASWIGDLRVDILVRGPELISCDPAVITDFNLRRAGEYVEPSSIIIGDEIKKKKKADFDDGHDGSRFPASMYDMGTQEVRWDGGHGGHRGKQPCREVMALFKAFIVAGIITEGDKLDNIKTQSAELVEKFAKLADRRDPKRGGADEDESGHVAGGMSGLGGRSAAGASSGGGGGDAGRPIWSLGGAGLHTFMGGLSAQLPSRDGLERTHDSGQPDRRDVAMDPATLADCKTPNQAWVYLQSNKAVGNMLWLDEERIQPGATFGSGAVDVPGYMVNPEESSARMSRAIFQLTQASSSGERAGLLTVITHSFMRIHSLTAESLMSSVILDIYRAYRVYTDVYRPCVRVLHNMSAIAPGFDIISLPPYAHYARTMACRMLDAGSAFTGELNLDASIPGEKVVVFLPRQNTNASKLIQGVYDRYIHGIAAAKRQNTKWDVARIVDSREECPVNMDCFKSWFTCVKSDSRKYAMAKLPELLQTFDGIVKRMQERDGIMPLQRDYMYAAEIYFCFRDAPVVTPENIANIKRCRKILVGLGCIPDETQMSSVREAFDKIVATHVAQLRKLPAESRQRYIEAYSQVPSQELAGKDVCNVPATIEAYIQINAKYMAYALVSETEHESLVLDLAYPMSNYTKGTDILKGAEMTTGDAVRLLNSITHTGRSTYQEFQESYRRAAIGLFYLEDHPDETFTGTLFAENDLHVHQIVTAARNILEFMGVVSKPT